MTAASASVLLPSAPARAESSKEKQQCTSALERARQSEQDGHLRQARDQLAGCARAACGAALLQQCTNRFTRLDSDDIPSIVPVVTDESGARRFDVQVKMDGDVLATHLDAQPIQVDPGVHEFSFSTGGGASAAPGASGASGTVVTLKTLIVEGQRGRVLPVALHTGAAAAAARGGEGSAAGAPPPSEGGGEGTAPDTKSPSDAKAEGPGGAGGESGGSGESAPTPSAAPPEEPPKPHGPVVPYLLGALGGAVVAGAGAGALLWATWGKKDGLFLASDLTVGVSVGAGVTALGFATWLFLSPRASAPDKPATAPTARYRIDVMPARSGAVASVSGAF